LTKYLQIFITSHVHWYSEGKATKKQTRGVCTTLTKLIDGTHCTEPHGKPIFKHAESPKIA
jgi:hypothetical protein